MRLKSFQAPSTSQAMKIVTRELGDDAVIVSTKTLPDGDVVITAAIDIMTDDAAWAGEQKKAAKLYDTGATHSVAEDERAALFGGIKDYGDLPDETPDPTPMHNSTAQEHTHDDDIADVITAALLRHNVPADLTDAILTRAEKIPSNDVMTVLMRVFDDLYEYDPIPNTAYERPIMMVGQPGAGKTLTVAKLAARAVLNDLKPCVITADTVRAGGVEQLAAFTSVLKLPLIKVNNADQLKQAIDDHKTADQIIIDSPGLNAFDANDMKELNTYVKVAPMDLLLALPAGGDATESAEIARAFSILGAKWMVPTRIDISRRIGGVLFAAHKAGLSFAGFGTDANVAEGLVNLTSDILVRSILPRSYFHDDHKG